MNTKLYYLLNYRNRNESLRVGKKCERNQCPLGDYLETATEGIVRAIKSPGSSGS